MNEDAVYEVEEKELPSMLIAILGVLKAGAAFVSDLALGFAGGRV